MPYNELIQRLRYAASYDPCIVVQDCKDAADAIEDLNDICQHQADEIRNLKEHLNWRLLPQQPRYSR